MKASELTNKELEEEYIAVCETIDVVGCFGTKDLMWRDTLEREIDKRGGEVHTAKSISFPEDEE
tara:strand:+ start:6886 stop:7077 length:192 start_codon:yes stop_codon:yes gene_type:complete